MEENAFDPQSAVPAVATPALAAEAAAPFELGYAPPAKSRHRAVWVIVAGLFTTAVALTGQFLIAAKSGENIMGWYANYVIPAGAIIVGLVASSGYAFMAWKLGVRVRRGLLALVLLLMVGSYFVAQYVEFIAQGPLGIQTGQVNAAGKPTYRRLHFWEAFHLHAVNWTWKKSRTNSGEGEPLGHAGYIFVALGIAGFSLGGLIAPAVVGKNPYCELCERYLSTKQLAIIPGGIPVKKISKRDTVAREQQDATFAAAAEAGAAEVDRITELANANDVDGFKSALAARAAGKKAAEKLPQRFHLSLVHCPSCSSGRLTRVVVLGQGNNIQRQELGSVEIAPAFVRAIRDGVPAVTPAITPG